MADIAKLKKRAAEFEQKKQLDRALAEYVKILDEMDSHVDEADVALYNRVGDLMLRQGNAPQAVQYYERAVDLYTEGGFFNNAIALCNKILRNSPGHGAVYYKLGKISAKKGFINDAKQHFLEYADRMQKENRLEEAFRALKEFADLCPDQDDIRLMLADQLVKRSRKTEAVEQLQMLYEKYEMEGRTVEARATADRMRAIDPTIEPRTGTVMKTPRPGDLVFLDVTYDGGPVSRPAVPRTTPTAPARQIVAEPSPKHASPARSDLPRSDLPLLSLDEEPLAEPAMPGLSLGSAHEDVEAAVTPANDITVSGIEHTAVGDDAGVPDVVLPMLDVEHTALSETPSAELAMPSRNGAHPSDFHAAVGDVAPSVGNGSAEAGVGEGSSARDGGGPDLIFLDELPPSVLDEPAAPEALDGDQVVDDPALADAPHEHEDAPDEPVDIASSASAEPSFDDALLDDSTVWLAESDWDALELTSSPSSVAVELMATDAEIEPPPNVEIEAGTSAMDFTESSAGVPHTGASSDFPAFEIQLEQSAFLTSAELPARAEFESPAENAPGRERDAECIEGDAASRAGVAVPVSGDAGTVDGDANDDLLLIDLSPLDDGFGDLDEEVERASAPLVFLGAPDADADAGAEPTPAALPSPLELLRERAERDPDDWRTQHALGTALTANGEDRAAMVTLQSALSGSERDGDAAGSQAILDTLLDLDPESLTLHQKRVEYAVRSDDRPALTAAYCGLADCLLRGGFADKARVIYGRVIDLAPDHSHALDALEQLPETRASAAINGVARTSGQMLAIPVPGTEGTPAWPHRVEPASSASAAPAAAGENEERFVNLADWLRDDTPKSTRMVVEGKEPIGDAQTDVGDVLTAFKQGVASNVDETDHESHYDLGVAYKQMGLLDEAIAEFQKALRGTEQRVRTYEALGQCFVEKRQYQIALTILARALNDKSYTDEMLVGVLYLLGFASESLGRKDDAVAFYERVISVDIRFRDVGDRLAALEQGRT